MKKDIPLDQAIALVRAAQKLNCDTGEQLHAAMAKRVKDASRLRKSIERLRQALKPFAAIDLINDMIDAPDLAITPRHVRAARAALGKPQL